MALGIPCTPVKRVERRLPDGRWVAEADYEQALEELSDDEALVTTQADRDAVDPHAGGGTIRIYLADWVREQLAGGQSTRLDFRVWAHLGPWDSACTRGFRPPTADSYDDAIELYLATLCATRSGYAAAATAPPRASAPRSATFMTPTCATGAPRSGASAGAMRTPASRRSGRALTVARRPRQTELCRGESAPRSAPAAFGGRTSDAREQLRLVRGALSASRRPFAERWP